ncbi:histidine kinase [Pelagicoccus mobilis]|uniref:Histidine kinase/HSP90-like ATPase domain-containing protein n=1 Tax=Pelagicoccus mobilis TaxID=415221 RepID=A0A934VM51_9BACT|nr:histidine kinase [Pelagicoccus mobilis]MBK1878481.1 hypothetical protein [Pelagicoccus mobilis]
MRVIRPFKTLAQVVLLATINPAIAQEEESPPQPLRNIAEITALSDNLAGRQLSIDVTGVVTAAEPSWQGQFFVQDPTGGVWVEYYGNATPPIGSLIKITGQSHPGAFAPIIAAPQWSILETVPLPTAKTVNIDDLVLGVYDGQRVELKGIVRAVKQEGSRYILTVAAAGHRLEVWVPVELIKSPESLIASTIAVRGTTATHYNQDLRHLTGVGIYTTRSEDFEIIALEENDPFHSAIIPIKRVAQHRPGMGSDKRIRISGTVTHKGFGPRLFIQDESAGLRIMSSKSSNINVQDHVEVIGFLEFENHLPVLNDAILRKTSASRQVIDPNPVPIAELKRGLHHGEYIVLDGRVLDRTSRPILDATGNSIGNSTTWLVQGEDLSFTIEYASVADSPIQTVAPIGSLISAQGVCFSVIEEPVELKSVQLLLSELGQIQIIKSPSWLTPTRLLIGLAILGSLLMLAMAWLLTVSKKNARLKVLVNEKQEAQNLLQVANDTLEQKVEERSKQLQVEMSARKEARVQFKAVIAERTRLARDLHDTLEQALTGIALQLETANKLFSTSEKKAQTHISLARRWLSQSQIELRNSIWDLRSRELEQFDLAQALKQSVERLADSMGLKANFATNGEKRPLAEILEENVLRIGQEAMTNVAKHSKATEVWVELSYSDKELNLKIRDNGIGFEAKSKHTSPVNHYGLLGMKERANRISGSFKIESQAEIGTTLYLTTPIENRPATNHLKD